MLRSDFAGQLGIICSLCFDEVKVYKKLKESIILRKIQIMPNKDFGTQQIESDTPIQLDFEMRLRPVLDPGKQYIEAEGSLIIDERRAHE